MYCHSSSSSKNSRKFSALEPDIAPETAVLRRRPPKTLLEPPLKSTVFYMLLNKESGPNVCSHLLWHYLWWDSRV